MEKLLTIALVLLSLTLLSSCKPSDYFDSSVCEGHGGMQVCYRSFGETHGHPMCKDGSMSLKECY